MTPYLLAGAGAAVLVAWGYAALRVASAKATAAEALRVAEVRQREAEDARGLAAAAVDTVARRDGELRALERKVAELQIELQKRETGVEALARVGRPQ